MAANHPAGGGPGFDALFLGYLIVAGAVSVLFLLYFNRVFASLVSCAIRTYTWRQHRIYLDFQALQISLLGGRIFFTGLRYHGPNESILVQNGHITWCYWLRRVRDVNLSTPADPPRHARSSQEPSPKPSQKLPCRINVSLLGLELFIYNRSPAYDSVLAGLGPAFDSPQVSSGARVEEKDGDALRRRRTTRSEPSSDSPCPAVQKEGMRSRKRPGKADPNASVQASGTDEAKGRSSQAPVTDEPSLPMMLQLLPMHIECSKAALVMGSENTRAVLIAKAALISGEIDAADAQGPDLYKHILRFNFNRPLIQMRENMDFKEDQADRAARERQVAQDPSPLSSRSFFHRQRRRAMTQLRNIVPSWRRSVESFSINSPRRLGTAGLHVPGSHHWQGLSRYLYGDADDERARWAAVEYAAIPTLLDSPEALLTVAWDVVGKVGAAQQDAWSAKEAGLSQHDINGDQPPDWTITLSIKGGTVNYGPWADRQRADLQRYFVPSLCKDAAPATRLAPGAWRAPTQFKLYIELDDEVTIRVPIREKSKNWRWKGKEPGQSPLQGRVRDGRKPRTRPKKPTQPSTVNQRSYGWLDIKLAANATVSYTMDMVAGPLGYSNTLNLDLPSTAISSSINHEVLWRCQRTTVSCDLSVPLRWNGLRRWHFGIASNDLELFLLRDHIFLLTDLVDDWGTGPPPDYLVFTPFAYYLDLQLLNLKLYLNLNDRNIIDNPADMEGNTYFLVASPSLLSNGCIPIESYRPSKNAVSFGVHADTISVDLHLPPWNTDAAFLSSREVGHLENLAVDGTYHYNASTAPGNTDTLIMNAGAQSPVLFLYGFVVRSFLKVKDNYFGDDIHFRTLEEYQDSLRLGEISQEAEEASKPPPKKANEMDVILSLRIDDITAVLPANLYSADRHVQIDTTSVALDLRSTGYHMDLGLTLAPLSLSLGDADSSGIEKPLSTPSSTQIYIDGVAVHGHRLLGLPPTEPTYLCNWDISLGPITGECTPEILTAIMNGVKSFAFTFEDDENALTPFSAIVAYDVTFLRVSVQAISLWIHVDEGAFFLSTGTIDVKHNDWARTHYSKRTDISVPDVKLSCINAELASRHRSRFNHPVKPDAMVQTSLRLALVRRKHDFSREREIQQDLVRRHDQRTHRTPWLLVPGLLPDEEVPASDFVEPPAQSIPPMPSPATRHSIRLDERSLASRLTSRRSRVLRTKSSFLSFSTASRRRSVVRPRSSRRSSLKTRRGDHLQPLSTVDPLSPSGNGRPPASPRDASAGSTGHSAFHSAYTEHWERPDLTHNTVAFSSPYYPPHFPLENLGFGMKDVAMRSVEPDDHEIRQDASFNFCLEDVDPNVLNQERAYSSILLEMPLGLTGFFTPASLRYAVLLLSALQPSSPDDILDTLHIGCMQAILNMQKDQTMKGHIQDVMFRLPRADVRFINPSETSPSPPSVESQEDQYHMLIIGLELASRSNMRWQDAFNVETRKSQDSLHLKLGSLTMSAAKKNDGMDVSQAPLLAQIDNVVVSSGTKDVDYIEVDAGNVHANISASQIDYLASLIQRTEVLVSDLAKSFSDTFSTEARHERNLVRRLILEREDAPDPSFLIRPPALLRSAPQHLRTFDSWKLMMRVRQIWSTQNSRAKDQVRFEGLLHPSNIPDGQLRRDVLAAFEKWRSWDLDNASESVFLTRIFGQSEEIVSPRSESRPLLAVAWIRQGQLVLDPGPKQNEMAFMDLSTRFENRPSGQRSDPAGAVVADEPGPLTIVAVYCGEGSISLNWELCELVGDVVKLVNNLQANMSQPDSSSQGLLPKTRPEPRTIHCVMTLEKGSIDLETINLNSNLLVYGLKSSVLVRLGGQGLLDSSYLFSCDSATASLKSHSQILAKFDMDQPSVFVSHELHATQTTDSHTVKATASSSYLSLVVKLDPINLTEVLDLIIRDEVARLYQMKDQLPVTSKAPVESKRVVDRLSAFRVNLAIFMDGYTISLPLLRSLTYTINGTVARGAMAANFGREIIFDFDVKENSHDMRINVNNVARSISLLQIPPTNGRVVSRMDQAEHSISVFASLELIQLDASAVYSLLAALNRPEITNTINELQQQLKTVQDHMQEIFGPARLSESARKREQDHTSSSLVYAAHLTFAGLEVFGTSPLESAEYASLARISFALGSVHLEMANRVEPHGPTIKYPHVHVHLRHITFEVLKGMSPEKLKSCGYLEFGALITASSQPADDGKEKRFLNVRSDAFEVNLSPDTVSTLVDVLGYMGHKIRDLDTSREVEYIRKLRQSKPRITINDEMEADERGDIIDTFLSSITYAFEICNIHIAWLVNEADERSGFGKHNLVLSLKRIEFGTRSRQSARLTVESTQLQMVAPGHDMMMRSANSALLPEVVFNVAYVSTADARRLAFQAVGKSLDLRLTSTFIIPAAHLSDSIRLSLQNVQQASQNWNPIITSEPPESPAAKSDGFRSQQRTKTGLSSKRLESLLVDADFAGAVVHLTTGKWSPDAASSASPPTSGRSNRPGRFGQFSQDDSATGSRTVLRSPGLAFKMELRDDGKNDPSLHGEVKVDASSNTLYPSVVPLIMDISNNIKEAVSRRGEQEVPMVRTLQQHSSVRTEGSPASKGTAGEADRASIEPILRTADPTAVLGRMKLNLGLRICRQDFSLSCQPIARVAATAGFDGIYITANTVRVLATADRPDPVQSNFFAISAVSTGLGASVQHVYSRESTGSFRVEHITLSLMNSRHVSGASGVSAILKFSPMQVSINAKQMQDFLLFREIWLPRDMDASTPAAVVKVALAVEVSNISSSSQQPGDLLQRYQQVAATAAFPWTATVSIVALEIVLDLGQALGKSTFAIEEFWVQSKKSSDWEQNLCIGFRRIGVESRGRMSGFVTMQDFKLRSSIQWPEREAALMKTPSIQASIGLSQFRVKTAFDYQAFLAADITKLEFLMFNIRRSRREWPAAAGDNDGAGRGGGGGGGDGKKKKGDRLVATLDGAAVQVFGTTTSAAQAIALYQAAQRLVLERRANFETSLREIERFIIRRNSASGSSVSTRGLGRRHGSRLGRSMAVSGDSLQSGQSSHDGMGQTEKADTSAAKGRISSADVPAGQPVAHSATSAAQRTAEDALAKSPISLDTDVVVTLKTLNLGVFPSTFTDHQVFKVEALNAQARFAASIVEGRVGMPVSASQETDQHDKKRFRIHSILGLTLGQLRIGLAVVRTQAPTPVANTGSGGGASSSTSAADVQVGGDRDKVVKADGDDKGSGADATKEASTAVSTSNRKITRISTSSELSVEEVVERATGSRGGTILKVPQVEAVMQTWQIVSPSSPQATSSVTAADDPRLIDYVFKSAFEGKVEVGWNYSRISFIRGMWADHSRTLAQVWGRELPAVLTGASIRVTQRPEEDRPGDTAKHDKKMGHKQGSSEASAAPSDGGRGRSTDGGKALDSSSTLSRDQGQITNKITAEVQVPQSRYVYNALQPPVIETPQLRDMGEATPPLEWIGLHRDRLPNLTHQIVIVALLELAGEVEDAYSRIQGSS